MTSNQLTYWRNQEEARSNRAREKETQRHNISEEDIKQVQNELEAAGLKIKSAQAVKDVIDWYATTPISTINSLNGEALKEMLEKFGISDPNATTGENWWYKAKRILNEGAAGIAKTIGSAGKGIGVAAKAVESLF